MTITEAREERVDFTLVDAFGPKAGITLPKGLERLHTSGELQAIIDRHATW